MCTSHKLLKLPEGEKAGSWWRISVQVKSWTRGLHLRNYLGTASVLHLFGVTIVDWIRPSWRSSWNPLHIGVHCCPVILVSHGCHSAHPLQGASGRIWNRWSVQLRQGHLQSTCPARHGQWRVCVCARVRGFKWSQLWLRLVYIVMTV